MPHSPSSPVGRIDRECGVHPSAHLTQCAKLRVMSSTSSAPRISPPNYFIPLPRIASSYTGLVNRCSDAVWERRFHIATGGRIDPRQGDATRYESVPYYTMFRMLDRLHIGPRDVVVDVGSGMGRAVCAAASYPIREAVGVELEPDLHAVAELNVARARHMRAPRRLHCGSAAEFDFRDITVILFFNPFGPATMQAVLGRIHTSLLAQPRTIRIGYLNATCAHVLHEHSWIVFEEDWKMSHWSRIKTPVHFYRTGPLDAN